MSGKKSGTAEAAPSNIIFLNMEYRRKSSGEALLLAGKATEVQIKSHIALIPRSKGSTYFASYTGSADICTADDFIIVDI
ncbi:hypothetical protein SAMN02745671_01306 [Anaerovibrio lipolyticus DSM 3074]|uniref:Uncharacterized protein n=2 Tax=Anaerovibrio lipolyticus TaxID=82374 RepID=A0A0B2JY20_9FIRM|nr:hypothetical protein [Anaerovibrio lipolyticus]KHM51551.1 hypothetical protein NZ47_09665 [Anaerovibrio lipolyticus]SHI67846.1 hypothetical protein SAMN02745671_01306 [Anaerovibrio lipolyticus DSM 3074]